MPVTETSSFEARAVMDAFDQEFNPNKLERGAEPQDDDKNTSARMSKRLALEPKTTMEELEKNFEKRTV